MANIASATSGLWSATSSWAGGVVPVVGDKVRVLKSSTGAGYSTDAAGYAVGATSINLAGGTGTLVAGESIQIGTDPAYYKIATGLTGGVVVLASPGLTTAIPAAVTPVYARGHAIEVNGTYVCGDDTSSLTPAANGLQVAGVLKFSRSTNSQLTARGTVFVADGGMLDMGASNDRIPSGITATLILNDSATLAAGKHGLTSQGQANPGWRIRGVLKKRNAKFTAATAAGATSFTVDVATGWTTGDRVAIASDTDDPARLQVVTLGASSNGGLTWACGAITNARAIGNRVGNLSSNVAIKSMSASFPAFFSIALTGTAPLVDVGDFRIEDIGTSGSWLTSSQVYNRAVLGLFAASAPKITLDGIALEVTQSAASAGYIMSQSSINQHLLKGSLYYCSAASPGAATFFNDASFVTLDDVVGYRCNLMMGSASGYGAGLVEVTGGAAWCTLGVGSTQGGFTFTNFDGHGLQYIFNKYTCTVQASNCTFSAPQISAAGVIGAIGVTNIVGGTLTSTLLSGSETNGNVPAQAGYDQLIGVAGVASDNRRISYFMTAVTDTSTRNRGAYSVKMQPKLANTATTYTFSIAATAGVPQRVIGYLRFDSTYGSATPPSIVLSGQGVTQSATAAATADTWSKFDFAFTPTGTGTITVTVTIQSSSTAGFAWLDGLYHYPMIQKTRHYGFLYDFSPSLTVDPVVQLGESAAGALGGIAYSAGTLTISGTRSIREVYDWLKWYEVTNQVDPIMTSSDGVAFAMSAALTISGALTGSGTLNLGANALTLSGSGNTSVIVTSSTSGTSAQLSLSGIPAGSTVYVTNGSGAQVDLQTAYAPSTYTRNIGPGATGTWTWKVMRYGYLAVSGTFLPGTGGVKTAVVSMQVDTSITQPVEATVAAYTAANNIDRRYDLAALYEQSAAGVVYPRLATKSGFAIDFGSKNVVSDGAASATFAYNSATGTITFKTSAATYAGTTFSEVRTTGLMTFVNGASITAIYTDSGGRHVYFKAPNLIDGSRVQLYDYTGSSQLYNGLVSGGAGFTFSPVWTVDKTFRLRADHDNKIAMEVFVVLTSSGATVLDSQINDIVYSTNAVDGSTVTELVAENDDLHIDSNDVDGTTEWPRFYAWWQHYQTTAEGIASALFGRFTAADPRNYVWNQPLNRILIKNVASVPLVITGGSVTTSDGLAPVDQTGGAIFAEYGKAYVASTSALVLNPGERLLTTSAGSIFLRG